MFEELVRVLYHDDGRVHHRADGDGDAAQRHDIRCQRKLEHRQERQDDCYGQSDDGYERGADVPQENKADQRHDDAFLDELLSQRRDRAFDELAAVVGGNNFDAFRQ